MLEIISPFQFFTEVDGSPLDLGSIYIGVDGLDAETNPQAAYWDEALTIPAAQPITTVAGYPYNTNAVGRIYTAAPYSITVYDKRGVLVFQNLDYSAYFEAGLDAHEALTEAHGATGAVVGTTNVQTITNKILTSPTINTPTITAPVIGAAAWTNAAHDHTSTARGGLLPVPGLRWGLNASNSGVDPVNDIIVAAGAVTDSTGAYQLKIAGALTGQVDGNFVAGTNQGKLDTGAVAPSTWYHIHIIGKTDGTTDILFSASYSAPTLPAGYTLKAYSGRSFYTLAGVAGIAPFSDDGRRALFKTPVEVQAAANVPLAATNVTLRVPTGFEAEAIFMVGLSGGGVGAGTTYGIVSNSTLGDIAPSSTVYDLYHQVYAASGNTCMVEMRRPASTSGIVTFRFDSAASNAQYRVVSRGWMIPPA